MNWRNVKFDWNRARAFLITAEEGSLSAAARALGMSQPTLGRQVNALEEELGVALFERGGRGLELTPSGLELMEHVRVMGEAASQFSLTASGQSESLHGTISITATEVTAAYTLPPIIEKLRQQEPDIEVELIASNDTSDLKRREADIALRGYRPTQPDLISKKIGDFEAKLFASRAYLESLGNPTEPEQFSNASFLGITRSEDYINGLRGMGIDISTGNFRVYTENHLVHWELLKQGLGIGVMPEQIGNAEPKVACVLPRDRHFSL